VSSKNEIVIKDSCILFDLVELNLIQDFFQLEIIAFTTPQVIEEVNDDEQWKIIETYIINGKLNIDGLGAYEDITEIENQYAALSFTDSSVLELAIRKNAVLLTSDGSLRKASISIQVAVRGLLWIIEELYLKSIITVELALEKLNEYSRVNTRAPIKEIQNLIKKLHNY
jgi:predicted nucleic acid-binding protein